MCIAEAVERGADCLGSHVGAVLVLKNRIISTGYNGTPQGFPNCKDGGCVRCHDSWLLKQGRGDEITDSDHVSGQALDRCVCVHAEQNAFITAARFGIAVEGATLYTTVSPCFSCLNEAVQVGVMRIVYGRWYGAQYKEALKKQYVDLAGHLANKDDTRFEPLGGGTVQFAQDIQPDPYAEREVVEAPLQPVHWRLN